MPRHATTRRVVGGFRAGRGNSKLLDWLVIAVCLVVLPSGVVHGLLGIDERTAFALFSPLIIVGALVASGWTVPRNIIAVFVSLTATGALASIVSGVSSQFLMSATLSVAVLAGHRLFLTLAKPSVLRLASLFTLVLLMGGVVGIVYVLVGGGPLLEVEVGYRTTYLYLTTFSLAQIGDFIRPSGIFDEPGALVMFAAIITMFNDATNQNRRLNFVILALLLVAGSLAGLLLVILYLVASNASGASRKRSLGVIAILAAVYALIQFAFPGNPLSTAVNTFYSDRLQIVDGQLLGDNRSVQVSEFFALVDEEIILRGEKAAEGAYVQRDQSSNPFSIVFGYGLIIALPYFLLLAALVIVTVRNRFWNAYTSLGLLVLLLQRPYLYNMAWSVMIVSAIWLLYYGAYKGRRKTTSGYSMRVLG